MGIMKRTGSQILDVQVIPHTRPIRGRVIAAEYGHVGAFAHHGLAGHLGQQGGALRRLTDPSAGV